MENTGKEKMEVYRDFALPMLMAAGHVAPDDRGEPEPIQDKAAQKAFLKGMSRLNQKASPRK